MPETVTDDHHMSGSGCRLYALEFNKMPKTKHSHNLNAILLNAANLSYIIMLI